MTGKTDRLHQYLIDINVNARSRDLEQRTCEHRGRKFENSVSIRIETKNRVSRTPKPASHINI